MSELSSSAARAEIVACETCGPNQRDAEGRTRGEQLLCLLRREHAAGEHPQVRLKSARCLWACQRSCAVHLRAPGRVGYVLVELSPDATNARALLDYAAMFAASPDGAVPYRQWPLPLRGHFLCRIPVVDPQETP